VIDHYLRQRLVADLALAAAAIIQSAACQPPSTSEAMTTLPHLPDVVFIRVDALEAALEKLEVTGIIATQFLHAVREEEDNLPPTISEPEQTGAVLKGIFICMRVTAVILME